MGLWGHRLSVQFGFPETFCPTEVPNSAILGHRVILLGLLKGVIGYDSGLGLRTP